LTTITDKLVVVNMASKDVWESDIYEVFYSNLCQSNKLWPW